MTPMDTSVLDSSIHVTSYVRPEREHAKSEQAIQCKYKFTHKYKSISIYAINASKYSSERRICITDRQVIRAIIDNLEICQV